MPNDLASIKEHLDGRLGTPIKLVADKGRKKVVERTGILADTYPAVFVVELDDDSNPYDRVSYSYADVLTNSVELTFKD